MTIKIGIVAGEASGDILGTGLIHALKAHFPNASFVGIGGVGMIEAGLTSLYEQDRLAVMGLVEPLKRLPELLKIRKSLKNYFIENEFDLFIGIDSPDFNLSLERKLKQSGIKTAHYVSPSVWAWRQGRVKKIARSVDLMLTLFPFENSIYKKNGIPVEFVGHPLANKFSMHVEDSSAKLRLLENFEEIKEVDFERPILACLPGSRQNEVAMIGPIFWQSLSLLKEKMPEVQVIIPASNEKRFLEIKNQLAQYSLLKPTIIQGSSQDVMAISDGVLLASGTTALEAMLLKKPMVVVYKLKALSYWILSKLVKVPYVSLPNLLADKLLVPELLQDQATPNNIVDSICQSILDVNHRQHLLAEFNTIHQSLQMNADQRAAEAISKLLKAS